MTHPRPTMAAQARSGPPLFVAYLRVSTRRQGRSGLGLEAQRTVVRQYVASVGGRMLSEVEEVETGSLRSRPQLQAALKACRSQKAILIIAKLDRLARDTVFLLSIVQGAGEGGIVFCDLPQLPPGSAGTFVLTLFSAVAQLERGLNSERTKAALRAAKERGVKLGTRSLVRGFDTAMTRAGRTARTELASKHAQDVLPFILAAQKAGASSLREVAAALTARGIQPPRGESWHPQTVRRILARAA